MKSIVASKIIITGGNGMVGKQAPFGIRLSHKQLDILSPGLIEKVIAKYKPTAIVHLAAMTDMLACEKNPKLATRINVLGSTNLAKACKKHGIKLVYLSTCAVFNGKKKTPYNETDKPKPINVYGATKLQGEQAILKLLPEALIIRTGWLFGGGLKIDKKFVGQMYKRMRNSKTKLTNNLTVQATQDRIGSPTYIPDLFMAIQKLLNSNTKGIVHVVNSGVASYYEIAGAIKQVSKSEAKLIPVKAKAIEPKELRRGKTEALTSSIIKLRNWRKALAQYLQTQM